MPFINIPVDIAIQLKKRPDILLQELLKKKILNVKEARLLEHALQASQGNEKALDELEEVCKIYFGNDGEAIKKRLLKFFREDSQVSWVLFTRTAQTIPYDENNPLEDYQSQGSVDTLIIHREHLIERT